MTTGHFSQTGICVARCVLVAMTALTPLRAQSPGPAADGVVLGRVHDSAGKPLANAAISLETTAATPQPVKAAEIKYSDANGEYRFAALPDGIYTVRVRKDGYEAATVSSVDVSKGVTRNVDIDLAIVSKTLSGSENSRSRLEKSNPQQPEFFDEPQFTVSGVTQASNSGGHGSDTILRTSEALARATVSLSKASETDAVPPSAATESSLRDAVARDPKNSALHHQLADVEEKLGHPLDAVREFQRAAELDPSEPNLFDWGTELLEHRALEPATEVFTKGNRLSPKSARMLIALAVASYAKGSYDQAAHYLVNASDLSPDDPTPYLFLGKMQNAGIAISNESVECLARFARLHPENALANYYYAVALWRQGKQILGSADSDAKQSVRIESLLENAVRLDPKLGVAYLQLGILYSERRNFPQAISAYEKAIEVSPQTDDALEESHYRLAQAYLRTGNKAKAQQELQLHQELSKKIKGDRERQRREIQEFAISLRNDNAAPQ